LKASAACETIRWHVEIAKKLLDGQAVDKQVVADTVAIKAGENDKADRYDYKSDCTLSY
jgi:hypothetical protein